MPIRNTAIALTAVGALWLAAPTGNTGAAFAADSTATNSQMPATDSDKSEIVIQNMVQGAEDAPVTLIEYASFTCPHCARFHDEVYPSLKADYIDTGKVRFEYREVYFDAPGIWAALVARCGDDTRYFGVVDMLFDKQKEWIGDGKPVTISQNLRRIGLTTGLDEAQLDQCLSDGAKAEAMYAHYEAMIKEHDISGTPSVVIGDEILGNLSYADLKKKLDAALAE